MIIKGTKFRSFSSKDNTNTIKDANIMQEILYLYSYNAPVGNVKVWNLVLIL